jgi:hypothetical protein
MWNKLNRIHDPSSTCILVQSNLWRFLISLQSRALPFLGCYAGAVLVARAKAVRHGPYHAAMAIWSRPGSRRGRGRRRGRTAAYWVARAASAGVASGAAAANVADRRAPLHDVGPALIALRRGRGRRRRDPGVAIGGARKRSGHAWRRHSTGREEAGMWRS